jgi:MHS family shikimate/dehydroshikimate transporter-like MFS transporter
MNPLYSFFDILERSMDRKPTSIRVVALASLIGTTIEWYDYFLYGTAAALVLNKLFFPTFDPLSGTLAALATYSIAFLARPIGGIVIGHYGDRIGRKSMLVLTLVIMGVATFLIGLLPTYATIGPLAPVLLVLLRIAQGFGVGGEWGGAILMAVEHAPPGKRGFYGSWPQIGVPAGLLLANLVYRPFSRMPEEAFLSWGWRVPFLISIVLVLFGLVIRFRIVESPAFTRMKETRTDTRRPIFEVIKRYPKEVLLAMGARLAENGAFYLYTVFVLVYATQRVHMDSSIVLTGLIIAAALELIAIPLYGALSDRIGRRPVYLFGALVTAVTAWPIFWMMDSGSPALVRLALFLALALGHAAMYAPQGAFFSELFGTHVRYSGASLGVQLSSVLAGGLSPLIATSMLQYGYGRGALSLYLIGMAVVTIIAVVVASETMHHGLEHHETSAKTLSVTQGGR